MRKRERRKWMRGGEEVGGAGARGEGGANFGASTLFNVYSFKTLNMRRKHSRDYMAETRRALPGTAWQR